MGTALGPDHVTSPQRTGLVTRRDPHDSPRPGLVRAHSVRWSESGGAHVLVVDPLVAGDDLRIGMASRGVFVTAVDSASDALVEFGRSNPVAVIVSTTAVGLAPVRFVETVRRFGSPIIIAVLDEHGVDQRGVEELRLAGATAVVRRPYGAEAVWNLLQNSNDGLDDYTQVAFGPIALDSRAFTVRVQGKRIDDLPLKEFEVLRALMLRAPEIVSNDDLRLSVWGGEGGRIQDNTLSVHITRLRNRLQGVARIRRIRGRGYSLTLD